MGHAARIDDEWYDARRYAEVIRSIWRRRFACPKEASQALRQTERAARNQIDGDSGAAGHTLFNAMKVNAAIVADVLRATGYDDLAALAEDKAARRDAIERLERATAILRGEEGDA